MLIIKLNNKENYKKTHTDQITLYSNSVNQN